MLAAQTTIAILDDDASVRSAIARLFQTTPYRANTYASAGALLAELEETAPKCLIVDFQMPQMNALELLEHLGRKRPRIPAIVVTALDEPETPSRCLAAGASAYLAKPVRRAELLAMIGELVGQDVT